MMYKIFLDGQLLDDTYIKHLKIYNSKLVLEQNGIGSFEFVIYPNHPLNNAINPLKSIVTVYQTDYMIFRGRVLEIENTMQNAKSVYCEGECGFMCDTVQYPYDYHGSVRGLFEQVINSHNSQVDDIKKFKVGKITVIDKNDYIVRSDSTYLSTWETIKKKFIESLGGYIQIRHEIDGNYIDYLADFESENIQKVVFGENMLSVKRTDASGDIGTVLIPLGAIDESTDERLTIKDVNNGKIYVENTNNISKYGRITKVKIWDDVTIAENLKNKAIAELNEMGKNIGTIEINAIDMANVNKDISNFRMHKKIRVISHFHDIDDSFIPMKMDISLYNPKANKIVLNGTINTLTSSNSSTQTKIGALINSVNNVENSTAVIIPTQLANLKKEVDRNKGQTDTQIGELDTGVRRLEEKTNELDTNAKELGTQVGQTSEGVGLLNEQIDQLGSNLTALSRTVDGLKDKFKNDTEWIALTLTNFKSFDTSTKPEYRVKGSTVEVRGVISPLTEHVTSSNLETFARLPQTIAPSKTISKVCQGSDKATWLFTINQDGQLHFSRYGVNGYESVPTNAWLAFDETYTI